MLYKNLVRPLLFRMDPESAHHFAMGSLSRLGAFSIVRSTLESLCKIDDPRLALEIAGLKLNSPIGLAAGFDKDCQALPFFSTLGFSHIELGTVTAQPQPGNDRPRIFRFPTDNALINRMGFPSAGADLVAQRLARQKSQAQGVIVGVNIGKTKVVSIDDALADYQYSFSKFKHLADYITLNVSSPNTPELRKLQEPARLKELISGVRSIGDGELPLFVKIAPDLDATQLEDISQLCLEQKVDALIATNTTSSREALSVKTEQAGGLSGEPLFEMSLGVVKQIAQVTQGEIPIIGVGGIGNSEQAIRMLKAGASALQLYTSLIYDGPFLIKRLCQEIIQYCEAHNLASISEINPHKG